eukprot:COSAG02_NODE_2564_length_8524_cov_19.738398_5_plen_717_part_00
MSALFQLRDGANVKQAPTHPYRSNMPLPGGSHFAVRAGTISNKLWLHVSRRREDRTAELGSVRSLQPQPEQQSGSESISLVPELATERLSAMDGDELIKACLADQPVRVVRDLLERGVPVNYAHRPTRGLVLANGVDRLAGVTALHACASGTASASGQRAEVMALLLQKGANMEARTAAPHGLTPFCCACKAGNADCAALLQAAGCDVHASSYEGLTGRDYAQRSDHRQVLRRFSGWGTKEELNEELRTAARKGRRGSVSRLLGLGGDPAATGSSGGNALHLAVVTGDHVGVVETILFGGDAADGSEKPGAPKLLLESKTADNLMTPFACACYYGRSKSVAAMLKAGCDVNAVDSVGWTGKDWAEHMEQQAVLDVLPHDSRCERPASRLDSLLPEPRRPDREKEAATLRIQARLRGNAARRHLAAEEARRSAAKAAAEARKEEEEARAAEAAAELEWGDVTKAERELKRAELSGDQARVAAAKEALAKELAEAEEAQAKADQERVEAEQAHEDANAAHASLKVASEAVLATVDTSGNEGHASLEHEHSPSPNRRTHSNTPSPLEVSFQEELATLRDTIADERSRREAAERRAEKAEALVATLSAELEQRAQAVASAADMRAAEAERRAAAAEERAIRAHAATSAAETMAAQPGDGPFAVGNQRQSSYKTRPWSGRGNISSWQRSAKEQELPNDAGAGVAASGGGEWIGVNHRNLFA